MIAVLQVVVNNNKIIYQCSIVSDIFGFHYISVVIFQLNCVMFIVCTEQLHQKDEAIRECCDEKNKLMLELLELSTPHIDTGSVRIVWFMVCNSCYVIGMYFIRKLQEVEYMFFLFCLHFSKMVKTSACQ